MEDHLMNFLYGKHHNIKQANLLKILYDNINKASKNIQNIIQAFIDETKGELWESEEELLNFYREEKII